MRILYFSLFLVTALAVYFGMHILVYSRIARGLDMSGTIRVRFKILLLIAALLFILAEFLSRFSWSYPFVFVGSVWLGMIAMAFFIFLLEWGFSWLGSWPNKPRIWAAILLVFFLSALSLFNQALRPRVRVIDVPLAKLPSGLSGFSIVQLSDLHLGNLTSLGRLNWIIDQTNRLRPDLIVITGDLIDRDIRQQNEFCHALQRLKARYGILAVTGNHEYYAGLEKFREIATLIGMRVLSNQMVTVAGQIQIAGLNDDAANELGQTKPDLGQALAGCDQSKPLILLYHRPDRFKVAVQKGVDLQLSGHTHAGQIPPMDLLVWLVYKYPFGFYRLHDSFIYTTCGTGTWGPPMRLFSRSEIVKFVLVRPQ